MKSIRACVVFFVALLSAFPSIANTIEEAQTSKELPPYDVGSSGSFTYTIPFQIPSFRGLEPKLGVAYNSANSSRGSMVDLLGIGWSLTGFSKIERKSQARGTPTFNDATDIFVLDGQALMACTDSTATNTWSAPYPNRFKTDQASASCLAGGNFSTIRESDRKILRKTSANEWVVYGKDGTQFIYRSAKSLSGLATPANSDADKVLNRSLWLLAEIKDTQATPNRVTIAYAFDAANGWAARPTEVAYAGYKVTFGYDVPSLPQSQWATGTGALGKQRHRLRSVQSRYNTTKINAYAFGYSQSPETGSSLLSKIDEYGNTFTAQNGIITGGAKLPNPFEMTYATDELRFATQTYNAPMSGSINVWDYDRDGRDDIFSRSIKTQAYDCDEGPDVRSHTLPQGIYKFNENKALSNLAIPSFLNSALVPTQSSGHGKFLDGIARFDPDMGANGQQTVLLRRTEQYEHGRDGEDHSTRHYLESYGVNPETARLSYFQIGDTRYNSDTSTFKPVLGNFDPDPASEFLAGGKIYDLVDGYAVQRGSQPGVAGLLLDMDGDALTEYIQAGSKKTLNTGNNWTVRDPNFGTTPSFSARTIPNAGSGIQGYTHYFNQHHEQDRTQHFAGDVNGDGKDDVIMLRVRRHQADEIWVSLSTGDRFAPRQLWIGGSSIPNNTFGPYGQNKVPSASIRDVNGDGMGDLLFYTGGDTYNVSSQCGFWGSGAAGLFLRGDVKIYLSDGTKFKVPSRGDARTILDYSTVGDFDGDGVADIVSEGQSGKIHFGTSATANLLTSLKDPLGGTTHVTYKPSTLSGGAKHPGNKQVVADVRRENGHGGTRQTRYSYMDETYDYDLRRSLGYKMVISYLPKIAGEAADPKLIKEYRNGSFAEHGVLKSKSLAVQNVTWEKETYQHSIVAGGNGPYKVRKTKEIKATRHGNKLLETTQTFAYSPYGALTRRTDLGRTQNGGSNVTIYDDLTTGWRYAPNLSKFIVDKPYQVFERHGTSASVNRASTLWSHWYHYDGAGQGSAPVRGNVTQFLEWDGSPNAWNKRATATYTYDGHGNTLTQKNALNAVTTHSYSGPSKLFRAQTTNALGHVQSFTHNTGCQTLASEVDPNGLSTTHQYDAHCRKTRVNFPNGNYETTSYVSLGSPLEQHIAKATRSGSNQSDRDLTKSREYFDGFGQTYKTARSASTENSLIAQVHTYDARGNQTSASHPLTWASANDNAAANSEKDRFTYDTLGRRLSVTRPNGAKVTYTYAPTARTLWFPSHNNASLSMELPNVTIQDERCFDNDNATICGKTVEAFDTRGNRIQLYKDNISDSDAGPYVRWPSTKYRYDSKGNLTQVTDPKGNVFAYEYDHFGNRTRSDDPSLGNWTLSYNALDNLTEQVDAKGQRITFQYDALERVTNKQTYKANGQAETRTRSYYDEVRNGYHNIGHLTRMTVPGHVIKYDYHTDGQIKKEWHKIDGRGIAFDRAFRAGKIINTRLPYKPGKSSRRWEGEMSFDAAGRMTAMSGKISAITYNIWDNPTQTTYASGVKDQRSYSGNMGWLNNIAIKSSSGATLSSTDYTRFKDGRIKRMDTDKKQGSYIFAYDYAGRLLNADNPHAAHASRDQSFTYDGAGRMVSNSHVGTYDYTNNAPKASHAPYRIRNGGTTTNLSYDANGNMTQGMGGKTMTYDAENRPLSVTKGNTVTSYVYGADGKRLKKIETTGGTTETTVYFGPVEIRKFGTGTNEEIITYPHPSVRVINGVLDANLHKDQLGSVRAVTGANGAVDDHKVYKPYGELLSLVQDPSAKIETKGFIGERFDAGAGLQYLNARYYDPELALFIQPDWYDVTNPRVGTARYSYSLGDPVNLADPNGNFVPLAVWGAVAAYKAISTALAVVDAIDTIEAVTTGEMTVADAAKSIAVDVAISATVGGAGKAVKRVATRTKPDAPNTNKPADCSCGCSSFHPDTLVVGQDGMVAIDQIRVGDYVLAASEATGALSYQRVTATHQSDYAATYVVSVASDDGGEDLLIRASLNHPFFVVNAPGEPRLMTVSAEGLSYEGEIEGGAWVDTRFLREGMHLREADGTLQRITGIEIIEGPLTAHNLTVEEDHTYFVGDHDDAVWVHNCPYNDAFDDHPSVGPGKNYTQTQKRNILEENRRRNGGELRDDVDGTKLVAPQRHEKGVTPPDNEAHVDHIDPRANGGANSYANANVRSRKNNLEKRDKTEEDDRTPDPDEKP